MKVNLRPLLNPVNWFRAWQYNRQLTRRRRSENDPGLSLYSQILTNDMLHYGYFHDPEVAPESLSIRDVEEAQVQYAQNIIDHLAEDPGLILDAGCGMGGLAGLLLNRGYQTEALTPDKNQVAHIRHQYPELPCYQTKFERFEGDKVYDTIIHSESIQYIKLPDAIAQVDRLLQANGRWVVVDYFRQSSEARHKSGHLLEDFKARVREQNWTITTEQDITPNVLPTLRFINMYAQRFLLPVRHFALEKLHRKKGWLYYLTGELRESLDAKLNKELAAIDPELFAREKRYVLMVIERGG